MGGSITGEHGVGLEKSDLMPLIFSEDDLELMGRIKNLFNPQGRLNPGKASSHRENVRGTARRIGGGRRGVTLAVDSMRADLAALVGPSHVADGSDACARLAVDGKVPDCAVAPRHGGTGGCGSALRRRASSGGDPARQWHEALHGQSPPRGMTLPSRSGN